MGIGKFAPQKFKGDFKEDAKIWMFQFNLFAKASKLTDTQIQSCCRCSLMSMFFCGSSISQKMLKKTKIPLSQIWYYTSRQNGSYG